jgi:hypothetical protein
MTKYDRDHFVCHLCFGDKTLQEWIKEEGRKGGACPWCGRRGYLIPLDRLGEPFREVTSLYVQVEGPDAYRKGDFISSLLDDGWRIFSEQIQCNGLAQELAVSILYAGLRFVRPSCLMIWAANTAIPTLTPAWPKWIAASASTRRLKSDWRARRSHPRRSGPCRLRPCSLRSRRRHARSAAPLAGG